MSHTFKAGPVADPSARALFYRLEQALNSAQPEFTFEPLHVEPTKTFAGMLVNADGTDFNPGYGAGLYLRDEANEEWIYLQTGQDDQSALFALVAIQTEQLRQLTKIALILSAMSGICVGDVPVQSGQLQQLTNIAFMLSSMSGITLDDNLELINQ